MARRTGRAILIVEADDAVRAQVSAALEADGFLVCGVACTREAWRTLASGSVPALVILDVSLPGGASLDLMRKLRALPDSVEPPVMLCPGFGRDWADRATVADEATRDRYVEQLLAAVRRRLLG